MIRRVNILNVSIPTKYIYKLKAIQITLPAGYFVEIYKPILERI